MRKASIRNLKFIPASHESKNEPGVFKKILFTHNDFSPHVRIQMVNWAKLPKKKEFVSHYHEDMDEVFIVISGKAEIKVGTETSVLEKGDAVVIPKCTVHKMKNISNKDVNYLVIGASEGKGGRTIIA